MKRSMIPLARTARTLFTLTAPLLLPSIMIAQLDRSRPPAPAPPPEVLLAEYESFTLSNGMQVIVVENHKLPLVNVQLRFDIPPVVQGERAGYVDMVGDLLPAGTGLRTKAQIDEEIDRAGAHLYTTNDGVYAGGLKKNLPHILDIVQDVVQNATFPETELERVRQQANQGDSVSPNQLNRAVDHRVASINSSTCQDQRSAYRPLEVLALVPEPLFA